MGKFLTDILSGVSISYYAKVLPTEGNLVYEYNPLRNYRLSSDLVIDDTEYEAGSIIDLDTENLQFDLEHPVTIDCQDSYDGSVNLIFNDYKNEPKLINTRFAPLQNNQYEIVDHIGNNDTNLYDEDLFGSDSGLYKKSSTIAYIDFVALLNTGNLKVGNYNVYLTYCDADGNETDFIAESGIISCFIGENCDPFSINGGYKDLNSNKGIIITVNNVDLNYDYIKVYYSRNTSDADLSNTKSYYKIDRKYPIRGTSVTLTITGFEEVEEVTAETINALYFIATKAKALATCLSRLFLANLQTNQLDYSDFTDLSLHIVPQLVTNKRTDLIGNVDSNYEDSTGKFEYYNVENIYYRVGYWNEEFYRFGIVYILKDGSLSNVFNICGTSSLTTELPSNIKNLYQILDVNKSRQYLEILDNKLVGYNYNSKGVIRFNGTNDDYIYSIKFNIPSLVIEYLKDKVSGFFFVRLKRIPTILAQAVLFPVDQESNLPTIYFLDSGTYKYCIESFLSPDKRYLGTSYITRLQEINESYILGSGFAAICPEFETNLAYYNTIFTGGSFIVSPYVTNTITRSSYYDYCYNVKSSNNYNSSSTVSTAYIAALPDSTPLVVLKDKKFRGVAGEAETAYKFRYIGKENKDTEADNLVRGVYSPYLAVVNSQCSVGDTVNIRVPNYSILNLNDYISVRQEDDSPYYAITDRFDINDLSRLQNDTDSYSVLAFRGDCYICNFTHRLNRNFQDPSAPYNDIIVERNTWKDNYDYDDAEKTAKINRGDVNAVSLGSWITVKVRASTNLSLRALDHSYPTEEGACGKARGFYPLLAMSTGGESKIPESGILNAGYGITLSERYNFTLPEVPYIKNKYETRIAYSDVSTGDAFKNGFRVFNADDYEDYPSTYGGIMKLVDIGGNLLCVFEHGIALIPVNERTAVGDSSGGSVYINTDRVLPSNPRMLSDMYGTQWPESVVKTSRAVYGVDTVAKKIWVTNGQSVEIISDKRVTQFLNLNITLSERELTPIIGVRNVKSHYNAFKNDVMFTFYDSLHGFTEKAWNLCWNEDLLQFVTFYSWIPSYSENIDNIFFSFDRDTSKYISKLGLEDGVCVEDPILSEDWIKVGSELSLKNRTLPSNAVSYKLTFTLEDDIYGCNEYFYILKRDDKSYLKFGTVLTPESKRADLYKEFCDKYFLDRPIIMLNIKCDVTIQYESNSASLKEYANGWQEYLEYNLGYFLTSVALTTDTIYNQKTLYSYELVGDKVVKTAYTGLTLFTNFWKHGQSGIIDIKDKIKPCFWYGKQHPFEFEFVVNEGPNFHKIFNNLLIISNNVPPESFHFEVVGDTYDFANDKKNMYFRLEATKLLYEQMGSNITPDEDYLEEALTESTMQPSQNVKSTLFPLTYYRLQKQDCIYDTYGTAAYEYWKLWKGLRDYNHLSGSEITYDLVLNQYSICTHVPAVDMKKNGLLRGNMIYKEDLWNVQINPMLIVQKNESAWKYPPIAIVGPLPNDVSKPSAKSNIFKNTVLADTYSDLSEHLDTGLWSNRKEARIRDKYIKIRVRYTGSDLVIISALRTLYTISFA